MSYTSGERTGQLQVCQGVGLYVSLGINHLIPLLMTSIKAPVDATYVAHDNTTRTMDLVLGKDNATLEWNAVCVFRLSVSSLSVT